MRYGLITGFILLIHFTNAQSVFSPIGAEAWSLGGTSATGQNVYALQNNPAGFAGLEKAEIGIYNEIRFRQTELTLSNINVVVPFKHVSVGVGINYYGYSLFNQQKFSVALSKKLSNSFSLGVSLGYFATNISEYGSAGSFLGEVGVQYKVIKKLQFGLFIFNPTQSSFSTHLTDKIPTYGRLGLQYSVSNQVHLLAEYHKTLTQTEVLRAGIKYQLHKQFALNFGLANNPMYFTFGAGAKLKKINFDFAASLHETLGLTPHLSLGYRFE